MSEPNAARAWTRCAPRRRTCGPSRVKRFYKTAEVAEESGRFVLSLDGRRARTPGRNPLSAASRALMLQGCGRMGAAARDDRAGRHAADAAPQLGDRRRRAYDGRNARRYRALRRLGPPLLPRRGAGHAGRAPGARLRSGPALGRGDARRALQCRRPGSCMSRSRRRRSRRSRAALDGLRRSRCARRAQRDDDADRLRPAGARCGARIYRLSKPRGGPRMSTRTFRPSAGAPIRRPRRGRRRAGANSRPRERY